MRFERNTGGVEILEPKSTGDKHPCFFLFHKYQQGGKKNGPCTAASCSAQPEQLVRAAWGRHRLKVAKAAPAPCSVPAAPGRVPEPLGCWALRVLPG